MAYVITKTTGEQLAVINDGSIDQTTTLTLVGRNYSNFGQIINENFVQLLENFSNIKPPTNPLKGQLWYDTTNKKLKLFNGTTFTGLPQIISANLQPTGQASSDFWFNTAEQKLYLFDGTTYNLIGPQFTGLSGLNAIVPSELRDIDGVAHYVLKHNVENILTGAVETIAVTAADPFYTTSLPGYHRIERGINLYSSGNDDNGVSYRGISGDTVIWGTAETARGLVGDNGLPVPTTSFVIKSNPQFTSGLAITSGTDPAVTINNKFQITLDSSFNTSISSGAGVIGFSLFNGISSDNILNLDATAGLSILPGTGKSVNIGSVALPFTNVYATSVHGTLADLAERYRADALYDAGTVLSIGGEYEVTISRSYQDERVAGIVSAYPAYAMNEDLGPTNMCPFIALKGRLPCKVKGPVKKGDLLVTSDFPGYAEVKKPDSPYMGIIGKALQDFAGDYGKIEVMV
jgi:hypothetical protein